ncbi:hypothetical protein Y032_0098g3116 [Ancylostoma ceylanicum]|uniref:Uncharacterized protein n=1 Tax=Ancylostoma ceylanicum TaxID=53326 RepID=A0A016TJC6_9BILA|nr:hypothetical protein Y032_0098g3116 [Ancylostoma ceylanicum]
MPEVRNHSKSQRRRLAWVLPLRVSPGFANGLDDRSECRWLPHEKKLNEEPPEVRGMMTGVMWGSIGIVSTIAITHIASSLWAYL